MSATITRKKMVLKLDGLQVETMTMPASEPIRAITTSHTCPTRCDTDVDCGSTFDSICTQYGGACA